MSTQMTLALRCDWYVQPDRCTGTYVLDTADPATRPPDFLAGVRVHAAEAGWRQSTTPAGQVKDACPFCWKFLQAIWAEQPVADAPPAAREPVYDDEYGGTRWRYGLDHRPLSSGAVPAGWIIGSDRGHPEWAHGTVDYPRELTDAEEQGYELALVGMGYEADPGDDAPDRDEPDVAEVGAHAGAVYAEPAGQDDDWLDL